MKRAVTALLAGGAVFAGATAFAASLGVTGNTVGAGTSVVASCDDAVSVAYTVAWQSDAFKVTGATVSGINDTACAGKRIQLTLLSGTTPTEASENGTATVSGATKAFTFTTAPLASGITNAVVTIYDAAS